MTFKGQKIPILIWYEVWADESAVFPYVLLLCATAQGFSIVDPADKYRVVLETADLQKALDFLMEDEYELVEGRVDCSLWG